MQKTHKIGRKSISDYQAIIYQDAADADWQTNPYATMIDTIHVSRTAPALSIPMAPGGGFAIRVEKLD